MPINKLTTKEPQSCLMGEYPWRDKEWCIEHYETKDKTIPEIANMVETSPATIHKWLGKHGIGTSKIESGHPVNDKEVLIELHCEKGLSVNKISEKLDVSRDAVKRRLEKHSIQREYSDYKPTPKNKTFFYTNEHGYEMVGSSTQGEKATLRLHRIMLLTDLPAEMVFNSDMVVHHENGIPWDNRYDNFVLMTQESHSKLHSERGDLHNLDEEGYND